MSYTISGLGLTILGFVASKLHLDQNALVTTVVTLAQIVGLAVAYYGRYRQGDITWYGKRLTPEVPLDSQPPAPMISH